MPARPPRLAWLFSAREDLLAFLLPTLTALIVVRFLAGTDGLATPLGPLGWLLAIVFVDVAHVWATIYRVYAVPGEVRRRPGLYLGLPLLAYSVGVGLCAVSALTFWRVLAYLALYHFIRQQYGWIALCGRRAPAPRYARLDRILDGAAVYLGTLYPVVHWHANLPRRFHWFVPQDFFLPAPPALLQLTHAAWLFVGGLWLLRQVQRTVSEGTLPAGKLLVMGSTWLSWYVGIVAYNSDVAFSLLNVLPHGIPYFVLLFRYRQSEVAERSQKTEVAERSQKTELAERSSPVSASPPLPRPQTTFTAILLFLLPLMGLAFVEEGLWDSLVWHDHAMLFPLPQLEPAAWLLVFLVPLFALPQSTHYLLDAWIWRVGPKNPDLRRRLGL
ncbi:MAG TPA: hypothetical protein PKI03_05000 [Pseudomonadota bacterium]|nr:hypothetical protein [Pseudomonadota bacterium]